MHDHRASRQRAPPAHRFDLQGQVLKADRVVPAPKKAAGRRNPLGADSDAVVAGGKLFAMHCAECHGEMAEGSKKAPSLLADEVQRATPRHALLAVDERRGPPRHACLVQAS